MEVIKQKFIHRPREPAEVRIVEVIEQREVVKEVEEEVDEELKERLNRETNKRMMFENELKTNRQMIEQLRN